MGGVERISIESVDSMQEHSGVHTELSQQELEAAVVQLERRLRSYTERAALLGFSYVGRMPFQSVSPMLEVIRETLEGEESVALQQRRRLNHVAVELLQNVSRHGYDGAAREEARRPLGFALFRVERSQMRVVTANLCVRKVAESVQASVVRLNSLTLDQVRALHKVQLTGGEISDRGGAGLGLMDVIMRSGQPLGVYRETVNEELDLLELSSSIPTQVAAADGNK